MAPEAAIDQRGDQRSYDAYSLGVVALRVCFSEYIFEEARLKSWAAQFQKADCDLDKWLQVCLFLFNDVFFLLLFTFYFFLNRSQ